MKCIISYIKKHYPTNSTASIAKHLNISTYKVRKVAEKNNIVKCVNYKKQLAEQLVENRRKWYEANIPKFNPTHVQEQIIFGSLLGDAYISKGAQRSVNYYYQEHFGENQREYREWKMSKLNNLKFKINGNYLRSPSHPYFTELNSLFYCNGIKTLSDNLLKKCVHPIFLATLYLDDGSLTISYNYNKEKKIVYCHPSIILYTLNFNKEENVKLATHLNKQFKTNFVVSGHPDGNRSLLKINKESDVSYFLKVISPFVEEIPAMKYKTCVYENVHLKTNKIKDKFGKDVKIKISSSNRRNPYSTDEINTLILLKKSGCTDKAIAKQLGRTYWSVVYKVSELRKNEML